MTPAQERLERINIALQTKLIERLDDGFYEDTANYLGVSLRTRPRNDHIRYNRYHVHVEDRQDGHHYPFYESMDDVLLNMEACRNLHTFDSTTIGGLQALQSYTVGGEWNFTTVPMVDGKPLDKDEMDRFPNEVKLADYCDRIFETFIYHNHWSETVLPWIATEPRKDGDCFLAFYPTASEIELDFIYPEQVRPPANERALEDYVQQEGRWEYGVHVKPHPFNGRWNYRNPLGFHHVQDEAGRIWEYLPSWPQPRLLENLRCGIQIKRNTHPHGARGVSDYYPVRQDIERVYKLARNLGEGSAIQAAIAMIISRSNTTGSSNLEDATKDTIELYRQFQQSRGYTSHVREFGMGTVIETDNGSSYESGPIANDAQGMFIEVGQWLSRRLGVRWNMPEYLITGDASNANYASTLVAESPFVKYCEHEQAILKLIHTHIYWRVLYIKFLYGAFSGFGVRSFRELQQAVRPEVTAPPVATQDLLAQTERLATLNERGILNRRRWAEMEQLPPEEIEEPTTEEEVERIVESYLAGV